MNKLFKNSGAVAVALGGLIAAIAIGPSPANAQNTNPAPTLPAGWTLYSLDCDSNGGQLSTIDVSTGQATTVGDSVALGNDSGCAGQGAYVSATDTSYVWNDASAGSRLASVNVSTGAITNIGPTDAFALTADAAGIVYTSMWSQTAPGQVGLATVDLATGATTFVNTSNTFSGTYNCAIAVNPLDDKIYRFTRNQTTNTLDIMTVDKVSGEQIATGLSVDESATGLDHNSSPCSMAIDSNGIAWIEDDNYGAGGGLIAVNLTTGEAWNISEGFYNSVLYPTYGYYYTMSLWLVSPPSTDPGSDSGSSSSLANTGMGVSAILAAGLTLASLGALALAVARRRKTT